MSLYAVMLVLSCRPARTDAGRAVQAKALSRVEADFAKLPAGEQFAQKMTAWLAPYAAA